MYSVTCLLSVRLLCLYLLMFLLMYGSLLSCNIAHKTCSLIWQTLIYCWQILYCFAVGTSNEHTGTLCARALALMAPNIAIFQSIKISIAIFHSIKYSTLYFSLWYLQARQSLVFKLILCSTWYFDLKKIQKNKNKKNRYIWKLAL